MMHDQEIKVTHGSQNEFTYHHNRWQKNAEKEVGCADGIALIFVANTGIVTVNATVGPRRDITEDLDAQNG